MSTRVTGQLAVEFTTVERFDEAQTVLSNLANQGFSVVTSDPETMSIVIDVDVVTEDPATPVE